MVTKQSHKSKITHIRRHGLSEIQNSLMGSPNFFFLLFEFFFKKRLF